MLEAIIEETMRRVIREELARYADTPVQRGAEDRRVALTEAAAAAGVSPATIRAWERSGKMGRYGHGRAARYSLAEVLAVKPDAERGPSIEERAEAILRRRRGQPV